MDSTPTPTERGTWLRALVAIPLGALWALALDETLALVARGAAVALQPRYVLAYLALAAAAMALLLGFRGWRSWRGRPTGAWTLGRLAALSAVGIYAIAVAERLEWVLGRDSGGLRAAAVDVLAAVLAAAAVGLFTLVLARLSGTPRPSTAVVVLVLLTLAGGLAVNRHLVDRPTEPRALAADAALVLAAAILAFTLGRPPRRRWLGTAAAGVLLLGLVWLLHRNGAAPWRARPSEARRPDIVLVVVDTLRRDVFQSVATDTPEGRALAQALDGAVWFDGAMASAPWTVPSMASLLTGLDPREHGISPATTSPHRGRAGDLFRVPPVGSIAEALRAGGYETVAIVTNPYLHPAGGFGRGFDRYTLLEEPLTRLPALTVVRRLGTLLPRAYQPASEVRRELGRFLSQRRSSERPLFLWLHLMEPHSPLERHGELAAEPGPSRPPGETLYRGEARFAAREIVAMKGMLASVWDHGLVLLTADHGEMFASDGHSAGKKSENGIVGHGHAFFEELVGIPLVIKPPHGLAASRHSPVLVSTLDLWPTILAAAGVDPPASGLPRSGHDLGPWLAAEPRAEDPRPWALSSANTGVPQIALRRGPFKLIHSLDPGLPDLLFDLAADPGEHHDLAAADPEALAANLEALAAALESLNPRAELETVDVGAGIERQLRALGYN